VLDLQPSALTSFVGLGGALDHESFNAGGRQLFKPPCGGVRVCGDRGEFEDFVPVFGEFFEQFAADVQRLVADVVSGDGEQVEGHEVGRQLTCQTLAGAEGPGNALSP